MDTSFLLCREPDADDWNVDLGNAYAGNYTLEQLLGEIQKAIATQDRRPHTFYELEGEGVQYEASDDWYEESVVIGKCNLWHLTRYEVYQGQGKYEAVIILYYEAADIQSASKPAKAAAVAT